MLEILVPIILGVVILIYRLVKRRYSYWLERGVIQPPTKFGFGNMKETYLGRENNGLVIDKIYKSYPNNDAVGLYDLLTPKLMVRCPELVKKVMVSDFSSFHDNEFYVLEDIDPYLYRHPFCLRGDSWKSCRASYAPLLSYNRIKEIYPLMTDVVIRLEEYVQLNLNRDFELKELATLFTMDIIASCVFGISCNCFKDPDAMFRKMGELQMRDQLQSFWKMTIVFRLQKIRDIIRYKTVVNEVSEYIKNMVFNVVDHRQKNNAVRNDLMQQMMKNNADPSSNQLLGQAVVFFVEGFEGSSMLASFSLYELALNSKIQDTLFDELHNSIGRQDEINFDTLMTLPYLDKVVQETMRKYPVMYTIQRICTKDISLEIDGNVVDIKKGTSRSKRILLKLFGRNLVTGFALTGSRFVKVWVPVYSIHHDPEYYPNPEVFDPERFNADNIASRPSYTFMPFGEGPRICVGYRFGLIQVKLFIAHILRRYRVIRTEKTPLTLTLDSSAWLVVPKEQRWVQLEERTVNTN